MTRTETAPHSENGEVEDILAERATELVAAVLDEKPCLAEARQLLRDFPDHPRVLHLTGLIALRESHIDECLRLQKRFRKKFMSTTTDRALDALALAAQRKHHRARVYLHKHGIDRTDFLESLCPLLGDMTYGLFRWLSSEWDSIQNPDALTKSAARHRTGKKKTRRPSKPKRGSNHANTSPAGTRPPKVLASKKTVAANGDSYNVRSGMPGLASGSASETAAGNASSPEDSPLSDLALANIAPQIPMSFQFLADASSWQAPSFDGNLDNNGTVQTGLGGDSKENGTVDKNQTTNEGLSPHGALTLLNDDEQSWFGLRRELAQFGLLQGYDELLCLGALKGLSPFRHQIETARKVLRQFHGRVLLADEVGLGKTVEAGLVLKEYVARGMVRRFLILTPAALVGQWHEEMIQKFDLPCATTRESAVRTDPAAFWNSPHIIASLATARRSAHQQLLHSKELPPFDLVVVDEAHHLKNRATRNWKLVQGLSTRYLLMLSATPVQNSLVELYNLLTLLKPGIFKTEKEFRSQHMTKGSPRIPADRGRMRHLMRDVMIRNTRALVDVTLPPRHAQTLRPIPGPVEADCYAQLSEWVRRQHRDATNGSERLALAHVLRAAGSSPAALAHSLKQLSERRGTGPNLRPNNATTDHALASLQTSLTQVTLSAKEEALLQLIKKNPSDKKVIFAHHLHTLARLEQLLRENGHELVRFDGSLSGEAKDQAIRAFRESAPILLSTEAGGEGRNIQFANTLINYDLPWNPMAIEQRIGRIHRIGQERDVYVFNLATRGTIEDRLLTVLDEKLNMFELVVGEVGAILGELDDANNLSDVVLRSWLQETESQREEAFAGLEQKLLKAREQYRAAHALDTELFGDDFETA